eukprot:6474415-Amphidinium_carterae.1
MFDAHHMVVVVCPLYAVGATDVALDFLEPFSHFLGQAQREWQCGSAITATLHDEYTGFVLAANPSHVAGGGKRSAVKRPRSPSAGDSHCAVGSHEVYWPLWKIASDDDLITIHLSVSDGSPVPVSVPVCWTGSDIEHAMAQHICCKRDWLDFTWAGNDVFVEFARSFPSLFTQTSAELATLCRSLPASSSRRRKRTGGSEVIVGHRASRKKGVTAYTTRHPDVVRELTAKVSEMIPEATFNALAYVKHSSIPVHRDGTNKVDSDMFTIPQLSQTHAWLWVETEHGASQVELDGEALAGSWLPYDRVYVFSSACAHRVDADDTIRSLVLYRTARDPTPARLSELVHFGFPLSSSELELLASPSAVCAEEPLSGESCVDSDDLPSDAPFCLAIADEPAAEVSQTKLAHASDTPAGLVASSSLTMLKTNRDGSLREMVVQIAPGSTVLQTRRVLKSFLHLNVNKVAIATWDAHNNLVDLSDSVVLFQELGPYLIRVKPSSGLRAGRLVPARRTSQPKRAAGSVGARPATLPIGARVKCSAAGAAPSHAVGAIGAPSQPRSATRIGGIDGSEFSHSAATSLRSRNAPNTQAVQSLIDDDVLTTPFERWIADKVLSLEAQQRVLSESVAQLAQSIRHSQAVAYGHSRASSSSFRADVQGGMQPRHSWHSDSRSLASGWPSRTLTGSGKRAACHLDIVAYNPPSDLSPHCLFASALFIADIEVNPDNIAHLRESVHEALLFASLHGHTVAGHPVGDWAQQCGLAEEEYVRATSQAPCRQGNSCDAWVCAAVLGTTIWMVDQHNDANMLSHPGIPSLVIKHTGDHFLVVSLAADRIGQLDATQRFVCEVPSSHPFRTLCPPRTIAMQSSLWRLIRDARLDISGLDIFHHRHFAQQCAHVRVHLMAPYFNRSLVLPTIPMQDSVTVMNGVAHTRHLPSWSATARMLVEVDIHPIEVDAVLEIIEKVDVFGRHCMLELIQELLQPHDSALDPVEQNCIQVLDATLHAHPEFFARFAGAFKFRNTLQTDRLTFAEFQRECRVHDAPLAYVVEDSVHAAACASDLPRLPPALILQPQQVECVRAAIQSRFAYEIHCRELLVRGGASGARHSSLGTRALTLRRELLYVPCSSVRDSLMQCVLWILLRCGWTTRHEPTESHLLFRTIAQIWLCRACRQQWSCAGKSIETLADEAGCELEEFLCGRCDPAALSAPAYVIIYAISCWYSIQMFVVNRDGLRVDGYLACAGWALQWRGLSWAVVASPESTRRAPVAAVPLVLISPTLSFSEQSEQSISSESLLVVSGGGKRQRVSQQSLEQVVVDRLVVDADFLPALGTVVTRSLLEHMTRTDPRFVRAAFQSVDMSQRLAALASALSRAGLRPQWQVVKAAADSIRAAPASSQVRSQSSEATPVPASPQMRHDSAGTSSAQPFDQGDRPRSASDLDFATRLQAIEMWAHAVDATDA